MNRNRKNGKLASCEPCRIHKIRCDHARPICGRCQKRGKNCFYHPAPLTRPRPSIDHSTSSDHSPVNGGGGSSADLARAAATPLQIKADLGHRPLLEARASFYPGHLGPASYAAAFDGDHNLGSSAMSDASPGEGLPCSHIDASRMHAALSVAKKLTYFPLVDRLVRAYYDISQAATIASTFILKSLDAVEPVYRQLMTRGNKGPSEAFISKLIENTAKPIDLTSVNSANDVHKLFTGEHLGLETLGILFAIAGRTRVFGLGREYDMSFADEMLEACDTILRIYDDSYPTNYLVVWLLYETTLLTMSRLGDANPKVWCRLGNLSTAVFALGIHRETAEDSGDPFWALEARRKAFAAAYQLDKSISTFLGRPPRICWRHCNTGMPLDMCDDEIELEGAELEAAKAKLDSNGWSATGTFHRASWIRCRALISITREEILDFSLTHSTQQTVQSLQEVARRCEDMWNQIPAHLHYDNSCWFKGIDSNVCIMLVIVWLSQLHSKFLIQRLFSKLEPSRDDTELLTVSLELLTTVLCVGKQRDRLANFHRDFAWVMLLYGLPSAGVLAARLQALTRHGQTLPPSLSRAELIRNLSVFVSYLEGISSPGDGNYALCSEACKILSGLLDETLNLGGAAGSSLASGAGVDALLTPDEPHSVLSHATAAGVSSLIQGPSALGDPDFSWSSGDLFGELDWNVISAQFVI